MPNSTFFKINFLLAACLFAQALGAKNGAFTLLDAAPILECPANLTTPPPPITPTVSGMGVACPGSTFIYSASAVAAVSRWTAPAGSLINGVAANHLDLIGADGWEVTVTFGSTAGQVCCALSNDGTTFSAPGCRAVNVFVQPPTTLPIVSVCHEDVPYFLPWGTPVTTSGLYQTTLTTWYGCDSVVRQQVIVRQAIIKNLSPVSVCGNGCITVAGEQICQPGVFQVVAQSWQGCDSTIVGSLIQLSPGTTISPANPSISCATGTVVLTANANQPASFVWKNANWQTVGTDKALSVSQAGTYHLIGSSLSGGTICSDTATTTVTGTSAGPTVSINASPSTVFNCVTTQITLTANSPNPNVVYSWAGPGGFATIQKNVIATQPGTYMVVATDPVNGCTATASITLTTNAVFPSVTCGNTLQLTCNQPLLKLANCNFAPSSGTTIKWAGPNIRPGDETLEQPTIAAGGVYTVTITNNASQCSSVATVTVPEPTGFPAANAGADFAVSCAADTFQLNGSGSASGPGVNYLWQGPGIVAGTETQVKANATQKGVFTLIVTENGCSRADFVRVSEGPSAIHALATANPKLTCATASGIFLSANGSAGTVPGSKITTHWAGPGIDAQNENLPNPQITVPGLYTLTIKDFGGSCVDTAQVFVAPDPAMPTASAGPDRKLDANSLPVVLDGSGSSSGPFFSYRWTGPGITAANSFLQSPAVNVAGTYWLRVRNKVNGCVAYDRALVLPFSFAPDDSDERAGRFVNPEKVGIDKSDDSPSIFPNPNNGQFYLNLPENWAGETLRLRIFKPDGRLIFEKNLPCAPGEILPVETLGAASGLCWVEVLSAAGRVVLPIVFN